MGRIQVMSEVLANQIAAGEVVERPASCVKELVENSLDAQARHVRVVLEEGGIARILVQDDGTGMDEADLVLATARHATSKVRHVRDLQRIQTLGFRGEALASIAAVARVRLASRPHGAEQGVEVQVEGGERTNGPRPVGMPPGTVVEVRDLFYNTPARLKYLRAVQTEQARCLEVLQRAALARPDVGFRCETGGRVLWQTPGDSRPLSVMTALFGAGEAGQLLHVARATADYRIEAWIGRPTQARSSRAHAHLFVNRRPIRNPAIHQAVVAAFGQRLMTGRHPLYVMYLEMDPALVDVNVHPHKSEVRFSEERDLTALVQRTVREALEEAFLVPTVHLGGAFGGRSEASPSDVRGEDAFPASTVQSRLSGLDAAWRNPDSSTPSSGSGPSAGPRTHRVASVGAGSDAGSAWAQTAAARDNAALGGVVRERPLPRPGTPIPAARWREVFGAPDDGGRGQANETENGAASVMGETASRETPADGAQAVEGRPAGPVAASLRLRGLRPIGQALNTYLVAEDGESLYIIDQHAAHERVLYERFWRRMRSAEIGRIRLLTPIPVHLTPAESDRVRARLPELLEVGIEVEDFGDGDVLVRTVPDIWDGLDQAQLASDVIRSLAEGEARVRPAEALRELVILRACKAAIKAHDRLSDAEMAALCAALADLDDPFHCPHGRPVILRLTEHDLEKGFRRIV